MYSVPDQQLQQYPAVAVHIRLSLGYDTGDDPVNDYLTYRRSAGGAECREQVPAFQYRISTGGGNPATFDILKNYGGRTVSVILTKPGSADLGVDINGRDRKTIAAFLLGRMPLPRILGSSRILTHIRGRGRCRFKARFEGGSG